MVRVKDIVISNPTGLHARPASAIILAVAASASTVKISNPETGAETDCQSVMGLLSLSATPGSRLHIEVAGEDSERLIAILVKLFESGFGEN